MLLKLIENPLYFQQGMHENHKKGGGGVDTSGLEEATKEATALQKQIYDQTRSDVQPWYQMGVGSVSKLSDLLGISGGSVQSRDQIYNELMPQYTSQTSSGGSGMYVDSQGNIKSQSYLEDMANKPMYNAQAFQKVGDEYRVDKGGNQGYEIWSPYQQSSESINYDALNSAVDDRLAAQGETPEGFGSLLERFDESKMQDSAGYQFRKEQGEKALERAMAAQGVTLGGAGYGDINSSAAQALTDYSQGLASQEYGNEYNRYVQDQLNTFNMLMGASGQGQGSTGIMATGGQNYATNVGNLQTGLASAQLNADLQNQSSGGMFGSLLGIGAGALLGNPEFGSAAGKAIFG